MPQLILVSQNPHLCRRNTDSSQEGLKIGNGNGWPKISGLHLLRASLVAQLVKNPPTMWETCIRSLGGEDPLEKRKATHSSILAWRIPWTGVAESDMTERLSPSTSFIATW